MKRFNLPIFILFFIVFFSLMASASCEESNSIYIKIYDDGNALWTLETRFELKTQEDVNFFNDYVSILEEDRDIIIQGKKDSLQEIVNTVAYSSGRDMNIDNISLDYQVVDSINIKYGLVRFKFLWKNFGLKDKNSIIIGDAFNKGSYIKEGEVLLIEYPEDYTIYSINPEPTEKRDRSLFWYGPKIFMENEPNIFLKKSSIFNSSIIIIFGFIVLFSIIILTIYLITNKKKKNLPILMSDVDKIKNILKSSGGKCFQNDVVAQSGLSKSKVSQIISEMEKNGEIDKQKYGKNNLIILKSK